MPLQSVMMEDRRRCVDWNVFQAVGLFRMERCPTQAVLPLVGLAAQKVIRDRYKP
ncbi:MAG: hypothetical protein ACQESR_17370 [Planctomycetota bacterium]